MIIGGNWKMGAVVIHTNGTRPTKLETRNWFLGELVKNIDSIALMDDLIKAVVDGDLSQDDVDIIINKAKAKVMIGLLVGKVNTMQYNHNYGGEYEQRPPFGWGQ